jgi:hypothetical protein
VAALLVALRRTAPALLPLLALLPNYFVFSTHIARALLLLTSAALLAIIVWVTCEERRKMPQSRLRRLPLLIPNVSPKRRRLLTNALALISKVADAKRMAKDFPRRLRRFRVFR